MRSPGEHLVFGERGAGSVLMVAIIGCSFALVSVTASVASAQLARLHISAAADSAALAAADVASGAVAGSPCQAAGSAAKINGARLGDCVVEGLVARVTVDGIFLQFRFSVDARAGPPGMAPG